MLEFHETYEERTIYCPISKAYRVLTQVNSNDDNYIRTEDSIEMPN